MKNETAVVVGVGPGLGTALVRAFANEGDRVVAAARSATALPAVNDDKLADRVIPIDCDATEKADVERLFDTVEGFGPPDVAIFNAGAFVRGSILETDPAEFELLLASRLPCGLPRRASSRAPDGRARRRNDRLHGCYRIAARWRGLRESRGAEVRLTRSCAEHGARARA